MLSLSGKLWSTEWLPSGSAELRSKKNGSTTKGIEKVRQAMAAVMVEETTTIVMGGREKMIRMKKFKPT